MKTATWSGCVGTIVIHSGLFVLAFAKGAILSHRQPLVMSATSGHGVSENGVAGGMNAVEEVFIIYVMTLGIAPLIVSLLGLGLGALLTWVVSRRK